MVDIEKDIIPAIQQKSSYFRKVRDGVYQTRCPECGDSSSNLHTGHMYLLINDGICHCYCHKCNASFRLDNDSLIKFIGQHKFHISSTKTNRINPSNPNIIIDTDILDRRSPQYKYLKWRLGCDFTDEEMYKFRIIGDQQRFFDKYNIKNLHPIPNTIGFVTADGNVLMRRNLTENDDFRWLSNTIYPKYDASPYTIRSTVDLLSSQPQLIVIAEGVFDVIGVYKHIMSNATMYVACKGKNYGSTVRWLIGKGLFGKNITIQIYSDDDVPIKKYRTELRQYRWMYDEIDVIYNDSDHDFGVPKDHIILRDKIVL